MINAIPDIPRIYTAIAEWFSCLILIHILKPRYTIPKRFVVSAIVLGVQILFLHYTGNVALWMWFPCMLIAFANMTLFIYALAKVTYWESCYYATIAFVIAECMASTEWQLLNYFKDVLAIQTWWMQALFLVVIYGSIGIVVWKLMSGRIPQDGYLEIGKKDWFTALFISIIVFGISNISFLTSGSILSGDYSREIAKVRTLVDIAGVAMLYAHFILCCENKVRRELEAVQNVLQNQYVQYKQSRDSIEVINYKYHDLKHQIHVLRQEQDPEKRNAFLQQMEEDIKQYELQNKTGNSVLDTVLTGKSMYCNGHGITLTSVADGSLLAFMDTMDICSIFGNALDNAIEAALKTKDKEKRLIHVTVSRQKSFLMIRVENYFESNLSFDEGELQTTKGEKLFHGYGIKSIRYTVSKYDGAVDIDTSNNWFDLKILIPLEG